VEFEHKQITRKCTKVLFAVVTVVLLALYFMFCAAGGYTEVFSANMVLHPTTEAIQKLERWNRVVDVLYPITIWLGILVNLAAIAFMVAAIWLIRRKVRLLNSRYGGTVHRVKLNEPVVGVHILMLLIVSAA
jgi:hypothetical protein